jgi:type II secretory pathway component PulK
MRMHPRSGAALLVVLAVVASLSVTAMTARLGARDAQLLVSNRMAREVALWAARSCVAQGRSLVDRAMTISDPFEAETVWANLDLVLEQVQANRFSQEHICELELIPSGGRLDVNSASPEQLARLFRNLGLSEALSDSLSDALLDWRDVDDIPAPSGAERQWYQAVQLPGPRNAALLNDVEIFHIRGFASLPQDVQDALLEALGKVCTTTPDA